MAQSTTNWFRVRKALRDDARELLVENRLPQVAAVLPQIVELCGEYSRGRKQVTKIGRLLLRSDKPTIIAPACLDYRQTNPLPALVERHTSFLLQLQEVMGPIKVIFLFADQEAADPAVQAMFRVSADELVQRLEMARSVTERFVQPYGWSTAPMSELMPNLAEAEDDAVDLLLKRPDCGSQLTSFTMARQEMYRGINGAMSFDEMRTRATKTGAQYLVLGAQAAMNHWLICNHSTVNLAWYSMTEGAVLHNPVQVY